MNKYKPSTIRINLVNNTIINFDKIPFLEEKTDIFLKKSFISFSQAKD